MNKEDFLQFFQGQSIVSFNANTYPSISVGVFNKCADKKWGFKNSHIHITYCIKTDINCSNIYCGNSGRPSCFYIAVKFYYNKKTSINLDLTYINITFDILLDMYLFTKSILDLKMMQIL